VIRILTTGGTIATVKDSTGRTHARLSPRDLLHELGSGQGDVETTELTRTPSWRIGLTDMLEIALAARTAASASAVTGVVVTHGTTTLEYTAYLTDLIHSSDVPVVFTGAMRRADDPNADGPGNLRDALDVVSSPSARGLGVLVCFAGRILAARSVWKRHRTAVDAFEDVSGPVGSVSAGNVAIVRRPRRADFALEGSVDPNVVLFKAYPGAGTQVIAAAVESGASGVVLEALPGTGGVPPGMLPALRRAAAANTPVVIAPRSPVGRTPDPPTGGTGEPLRGLSLLSAGDLSAEKAWVLLSVALGQLDLTPRRIFEAYAQLEDQHV
jgi:L-asparaginase